MGYIDKFKQNKPFEQITQSLRRVKERNPVTVQQTKYGPLPTAPKPVASAALGRTQFVGPTRPATPATQPQQPTQGAVTNKLRNTAVSNRTAARSVTPAGPTEEQLAAQELQRQRDELLGGINTKYDRLRQALVKRREGTVSSYDAAEADVNTQLSTARTQAKTKLGEVDVEFNNLVNEGSKKQEKLQGALGAAFAARGLSSSSGSEAATKNADDEFKKNLEALGTEKKAKYSAINDALTETEMEASKEINRLRLDRQQALDDVDNDITLTEEERTAAVRDLEDSFQEASQKAAEKAAEAKAKKVTLSKSAQAEANFDTATKIDADINNAFSQLIGSGISPAGNAQAVALVNGSIAKKYGIDPKESFKYVDQLFRELDRKRKQQTEVF